MVVDDYGCLYSLKGSANQVANIGLVSELNKQNTLHLLVQFPTVMSKKFSYCRGTTQRM